MYIFLCVLIFIEWPSSFFINGTLGEKKKGTCQWQKKIFSYRLFWICKFSNLKSYLSWIHGCRDMIRIHYDFSNFFFGHNFFVKWHTLISVCDFFSRKLFLRVTCIFHLAKIFAMKFLISSVFAISFWIFFHCLWYVEFLFTICWLY